MEGIEEAKGLVVQQRYREAADALDRMLATDSGRDDLWYLRGIVSLKMKNYDAALECFERALLLGRRSRYYQIKGMAHFELFEMDQAVEAFGEALAIEPKDATTNFFLAICYMFMDDPRSDAHIRRARELDGRKTRQLLLNFYTLFMKDDPRINDAQKKRIEERMNGLK
ncbi:MAG: tetratricopeptide repeat protein [Candidatus Micrarchaeota archaeon]